jgi:uncharacterized protein (DUF305 family)
LTCPVAATSGRAALLGILLVLSLGLAAGGAAAGHEHGAGTQGTPTHTPVLYTEDELEFLTHMIVHHEQALVMAALVPARTQREEFKRFARYVDGSQRVEIDQMKSLLQFASDRGIEIPHHEMTGDPPMAGMLSKAQMAALAAASGPEFERLWLQGMIYHHQGGLDMARAQQQRQFESRRQPYGIDVLVDDILVVQRAEITKMRGWLTQWGLARPADAH